VIRKYQPADCEEVLNVWARASAVAHSFLTQEFLKSERQQIADVYLPKADTWVWEADGHVVGFISLLGNEVGGLFVDPKSRQSGIGRALMDRARALRCELEVEVFKRNLPGRVFYVEHGFEPIEKRIHPETGLEVMRLRLAADAVLRPGGSPNG